MTRKHVFEAAPSFIGNHGIPHSGVYAARAASPVPSAVTPPTHSLSNEPRRVLPKPPTVPGYSGHIHGGRDARDRAISQSIDYFAFVGGASTATPAAQCQCRPVAQVPSLRPPTFRPSFDRGTPSQVAYRSHVGGIKAGYQGYVPTRFDHIGSSPIGGSRKPWGSYHQRDHPSRHTVASQEHRPASAASHKALASNAGYSGFVPRGAVSAGWNRDTDC